MGKRFGKPVPPERDRILIVGSWQSGRTTVFEWMKEMAAAEEKLKETITPTSDEQGNDEASSEPITTTSDEQGNDEDSSEQGDKVAKSGTDEEEEDGDAPDAKVDAADDDAITPFYGFPEDDPGYGCVSYRGFTLQKPISGGGRENTLLALSCPQFYSGVVAAVVFIIDSDSTGSWSRDYTKEEMSVFRRSHSFKDLSFYAIANKQDLPDAKSAKEVEEIINEGQHKGRLKVFPATATKGEGVRECFDSIVDEIEGRRRKSTVTQPWKEVAEDIKKDGTAGMKVVKGTWNKLRGICRSLNAKST